MKYHDESTKVSSVSVSRNAGAPHVGHATCFHVGWRSSGLPGTSKLTSSGSVTGSWSLGTATGPQAAQWTIGIGVPQRSEEHTSELQSLMRNSYAVFCLKKKNKLNKKEEYRYL